MSDPAGGNLNISIEKLVGSMERMYEQQVMENDRMENMLSLLGRLSEMVRRMEEIKGFESELNQKLDLLNKTLERTLGIQENLIRGQEGVDTTLFKVVGGINTFGQILSIVAASIQLTIENIGSVLNKNPAKTEAGDGYRPEGVTPDLNVVLQPLNTLVKGLAEGKMRQQNNPGKQAGEIDENN